MLLALPNVSWASAVADLSGQAAQLTSPELKSSPSVITAMAYISGAVFSFTGLVKLKAFAEDPTQTPIRPGLGRLAAGSAMLFLPDVTRIVGSMLGLDKDGAATSHYTSAHALAASGS